MLEKCLGCKNFIRYYTFDGKGGFSEINKGFCKKRTKNKKECDKYIAREKEGDDIINQYHLLDKINLKLSYVQGYMTAMSQQMIELKAMIEQN